MLLQTSPYATKVTSYTFTSYFYDQRVTFICSDDESRALNITKENFNDCSFADVGDKSSKNYKQTLQKANILTMKKVVVKVG